MIVLYTLTRLLLSLFWLLCSTTAKWYHARAVSMFRKMNVTAERAPKPFELGDRIHVVQNSTLDAVLAARQLAANLVLGKIAGRFERLNDKATTWDVRTGWFYRLRQRLAGARGKALPYTFGFLDVTTALTLADSWGFSSRELIGMAVTWWQLVALPWLQEQGWHGDTAMMGNVLGVTLAVMCAVVMLFHSRLAATSRA